MRIATGGVLPPGSDAVLMVESTQLVEHDVSLPIYLLLVFLQSFLCFFFVSAVLARGDILLDILSDLLLGRVVESTLLLLK